MVAVPVVAESVLSPEELAQWIEIVEEVDSDPQFLTFLQRNHPEEFERFVGTIRSLHSASARQLWRSADGRGGAARPAQLMPGTPGSASDRTDWRVWLLMAGRGCVAAGTLIETVDGRKVPVESWRGGWVRSCYEDGSVAPALAGPAFLKGRAPLFRVATARGDEIVVTDQHRFLSPSGWVRLAEIGVGSEIAAAVPSASLAGGRRWSDTAPGSRADCRPRRSWTEIVAITPIGEGDFYDLTVHGTHNYVANGLVNHNSGKSWAAAQAVRELLTERRWKSPPHFALVSSTLEACRVDMIEGVLEQVLGHEIARYNRSTLEIWLHNGAYIKGYSSERPSRLRGPNFVGAWADEIASWLDADRSPAEDSTWSNLEFATRASDAGDWHPRIIATTTPKPVRLLRVRDKNDPFYPGLVDDSEVVLTHMTTEQNKHNLAPSFHKRLVARYQGSRLGRQEIGGELIDEIEGALWSAETVMGMNSTHKALMGFGGGVRQVIVAVDPTIGDGEVSNDECGIVVAALDHHDTVWILEDCSLKATPTRWAAVVGNAYTRWGASLVIAEKNQGGVLVRDVLTQATANLPVRLIQAKDTKRVRAEGPSIQSSQGNVKFAHQRMDKNQFALLQDQLMTWDPFDKESPDRLDAFCYAVTFFKPPTPMVTSEGGRAYQGVRGRQRRQRRHAARRSSINNRDPARNPRSKRRLS